MGKIKGGEAQGSGEGVPKELCNLDFRTNELNPGRVETPTDQYSRSQLQNTACGKHLPSMCDALDSSLS